MDLYIYFLVSMYKYLILLLIPFDALANNEDYHNNIYCSKEKGIKEFILENKVRVDCLTKDYAIEMDWCNKWYEGITQALYYAMLTNNKAKLVLIKNSSNDNKYINRALQTIRFYNLPITLEVIKVIQ